MSAITPETREKLNSKTINRIKIAAIHTTQEVDVVLITIELPNRVIKKTIKAAAGHCSLVKKQLRPHIGSLITLNKTYFYVGRLRPPIKPYSGLLTD